MKKKLSGIKFGQTSDPKLGFLPFTQVWFISFPLNCIDDSLEHCLTTSRSKSMKKNWGAPNWVVNFIFCHFLRVAWLVFLFTAQDCSLRQCLISNTFVAQIGAEMLSTQICLFDLNYILYCWICIYNYMKIVSPMIFTLLLWY